MGRGTNRSVSFMALSRDTTLSATVAMMLHTLRRNEPFAFSPLNMVASGPWRTGSVIPETSARAGVG